MNYRVRVRYGPLRGRDGKGAYLNILPSEYVVRHKGNTLTFQGADTRDGGDLVVDLGDYERLQKFPDHLEQSPLVVLEKLE